MAAYDQSVLENSKGPSVQTTREAGTQGVPFGAIPAGDEIKHGAASAGEHAGGDQVTVVGAECINSLVESGPMKSGSPACIVWVFGFHGEKKLGLRSGQPSRGTGRDESGLDEGPCHALMPGGKLPLHGTHACAEVHAFQQ